MANKIGSNMAIFSVAGVDLKSDAKDFNLKVDNEALDTSVLSQAGKRTAAGQADVTISFNTFTPTSGDCAKKIGATSLTVLTVGGTSYLTSFKTLNFALAVNTDDVSGGADVFKSHQGVTFDLTGDIEVMVSNAATHPWWTLLLSSGSSMQAVLSFTLAGEAITVPMTIVSGEYVSANDAVTVFKLNFQGYPACTGDYPTAPTTEGSLLSAFLIDPLTAVAIEYKSQATNAEYINHNFILSNLSFAIERGQIIETSYEFKGVGVPDITP